MLNVGVVWYSCGCGLCDVECCALRCGGVKWWWEADCGVMSDTDRIWWSEVRCVATLNVAWNMRYVVM